MLYVQSSCRSPRLCTDHMSISIGCCQGLPAGISLQSTIISYQLVPFGTSALHTWYTRYQVYSSTNHDLQLLCFKNALPLYEVVLLLYNQSSLAHAWYVGRTAVVRAPWCESSVKDLQSSALHTSTSTPDSNTVGGVGQLALALV